MPIGEWRISTPIAVATPSLPPISPLRGLLEVTRLVRAGGDLPELLACDRADDRRIARLRHRSSSISTGPRGTTSASRPCTGATPRARSCSDQVRGLSRLAARCSTSAFHGAAHMSCRQASSTGTSRRRSSYVPAGRGGAAASMPGIQRTRSSSRCGTPPATCSASCPSTSRSSRRRPTDEELDVLVALADHAALAVQSAQEAVEAARHKVALEQLLEVSSRLPAEPVADEILRAVCAGVRDALGFQNVLAVLRDGRGAPRPAAPRSAGASRRWSVPGRSFLRDVEGLLDPEFETEGLLSSFRARRRSAASRSTERRTRRR